MADYKEMSTQDLSQFKDLRNREAKSCHFESSSRRYSGICPFERLSIILRKCENETYRGGSNTYTLTTPFLLPFLSLSHKMPAVILERNVPASHTSNPLPQILQTPSGLALLEIQGKIHVGNLPLIRSSQDLHIVDEDQDNSNVVNSGDYRKLGSLEFADNGKDVNMIIGKHQRLRGKVTELKVPLAVLKMDGLSSVQSGSQRTQSGNTQSVKTVPVLEIIKYKILFNTRPEPVV